MLVRSRDCDRSGHCVELVFRNETRILTRLAVLADPVETDSPLTAGIPLSHSRRVRPRPGNPVTFASEKFSTVEGAQRLPYFSHGKSFRARFPNRPPLSRRKTTSNADPLRSANFPKKNFGHGCSRLAAEEYPGKRFVSIGVQNGVSIFQRTNASFDNRFRQTEVCPGRSSAGESANFQIDFPHCWSRQESGRKRIPTVHPG